MDQLAGLEKTILVAVAVIGGCFLIKYFWKWSNIRKKITLRQAERKTTVEKLEEYLVENGISDEERKHILKMSLVDLQAKLLSGDLDSVMVLKAYQLKALEVNKRTNCLVDVLWEAEPTAALCDTMKPSEKGLLHGVPVSIKEHYYIKGYDSTGGMAPFLNKPAKEDGVLIKVLKHQGAVPFVKTNIPQCMMTFECSNPIYGVTVNPHNALRGPGGSSGGEGALIGGGGSILGWGSDIGGSLRIPSNMCGVSCLKPTCERISLKYGNELVCGQHLIKSAPGPMARDVDSLVLAMKAVLIPYMFDLDPQVVPIPFRKEIYESKEPLRIGYYSYDGVLRCIPAVERAVYKSKEALEKLGHTLVPFQPPRLSYAFTELFCAICFGDGGKSFLDLWDEDEIDPSISLVVRTYKLPHFVLKLLSYVVSFFANEQLTRRMMQSMLGVRSVTDWWKLSERLAEYKREFHAAWRASNVDVVICPTMPFAAAPTGKVKYLLAGTVYTTPYNVLNYPAGCVPVTKVTAVDQAKMKDYPAKTATEKFIRKFYSADTGGLPITVQCVGLPYNEELVLRVMKELETAIRK